jgi:hypothetical protein
MGSLFPHGCSSGHREPPSDKAVEDESSRFAIGTKVAFKDVKSERETPEPWRVPGLPVG